MKCGLCEEVIIECDECGLKFEIGNGVMCGGGNSQDKHFCLQYCSGTEDEVVE